MTEDNYDDAPDEGESAEAPASEEAEDSPTALLPKEFFAGKDLKPGTRCEIEVVSVQDDSVQVKYLGHAKGESKQAEMPMAGNMDSESMYA